MTIPTDNFGSTQEARAEPRAEGRIPLQLRRAVMIIAEAIVLILVACRLDLICQEQPRHVSFQSEGDVIHAVLFRGVGDGPHPTAVLLHGFPGGEGDVFGIGAVISADGWNVLACNYRGMFKNGGTNTPWHTVADAAAALDYLQHAGFSFIAPGQFITIGYSYGGWVALLTAARDSRVCCAAGIGAGNIGMLAEDMRGDAKVRAYWEDQLEHVTCGNPARGVGGKQTVEEMIAHSAEFDLRNFGTALSLKSVLLIGGWRDRIAPLEKYMLPIARAIEAADGSMLTPVVLDDDHSFRTTREHVHAAIRRWLQDTCRPLLQL